MLSSLSVRRIRRTRRRGFSCRRPCPQGFPRPPGHDHRPLQPRPVRCLADGATTALTRLTGHRTPNSTSSSSPSTSSALPECPLRAVRPHLHPNRARPARRRHLPRSWPARHGSTPMKPSARSLGQTRALHQPDRPHQGSRITRPVPHRASCAAQYCVRTSASSSGDGAGRRQTCRLPPPITAAGCPLPTRLVRTGLCSSRSSPLDCRIQGRAFAADIAVMHPQPPAPKPLRRPRARSSSSPAARPLAPSTSRDLAFEECDLLLRVIEELCARGLVAVGAAQPPEGEHMSGPG